MKQTIAKNLEEIISVNLKRFRARRRQKEAAAGIGVKHKTYQAWEEKRAIPPTRILLSIKKYFRLKSIDDIFRDVSG